MDNFYLDKTDFTPAIKFNYSENHFLMEGESKPESPRKFYSELVHLIDLYFKKKHFLLNEGDKKITKSNFDFKLTYINSTSAKMIFDLLQFIKKHQESSNCIFSINWFHKKNDADMLESGKEFEELTGLEFNYFTY